MSFWNEQHIDTDTSRGEGGGAARGGPLWIPIPRMGCPAWGAGMPASANERVYDLVAIDVDGTLVTSENKLPVGIAPLLRKAPARGTGVTLVSGRSKLKMTPLLKVLGLTLPYIGSGGAYIADPSNNLVILHRPLAREAVAEIVAPSNDEDGVAWVLRELVLKEYGSRPKSCSNIVKTNRTVQHRNLEGDQDGSQPIL